jgi:hypothetical protein
LVGWLVGLVPFVFTVLGIKSRALCKLGRYSTTNLHPQLPCICLNVTTLVIANANKRFIDQKFSLQKKKKTHSELCILLFELLWGNDTALEAGVLDSIIAN